MTFLHQKNASEKDAPKKRTVTRSGLVTVLCGSYVLLRHYQALASKVDDPDKKEQ